MLLLWKKDREWRRFSDEGSFVRPVQKRAQTISWRMLGRISSLHFEKRPFSRRNIHFAMFWSAIFQWRHSDHVWSLDKTIQLLLRFLWLVCSWILVNMFSDNLLDNNVFSSEGTPGAASWWLRILSIVARNLNLFLPFNVLSSAKTCFRNPHVLLRGGQKREDESGIRRIGVGG